MKVGRATSVLMVIVAMLGIMAASWLDLGVGPPHAFGALELITTWIALIVMSAMGIRIVFGDHRQLVGWILVIMALVGGVESIAKPYGFDALVAHADRLPAAQLAAAIDSSSWILAFAGLTALLFVFPTGHLPSRGWRPVAIVSAIGFVGAWFGATFQPDTFDAPFEGLKNQVAWPFLGGSGQLLVGAFVVLMFAGITAAVISVVGRVMESEGPERQQMKWLCFGAGLLPITVAACLIGRVFTGANSLSEVVLQFAIVAIPLAAGIAVLRLHLYDIDYLISRTAVYLTVTAVAGGAFVVVVLGVGVGFGGHSALAGALAALVAVASVRPVRRHAQKLIDQYFDQGKYDAMEIVRRFQGDLRDGRESPERIESVLRTALGDPSLSVHYWLPVRQVFVNSDNSEVDSEKESPGRGVFTLNRGREQVAIVGYDPLLCRRPDVLRDVMRSASLSVEMARLNADVAVHLNEVRASRARIMEAGDQERRRLERDLHDGAQQRLVALGLRLRRLQHSLPREALILEPALEGAISEISDAIADLRRIASGARPARLDDGLTAAIGDLVRTLPIKVDVDLSDDRAPLGIESTAYFVVCETITNAMRHGQATEIRVRTEVCDNGLKVEVIDDGVGGAKIGAAGGLSGLADRVAAVGGSMDLRSALGGGTRVKVQLPCEW